MASADDAKMPGGVTKPSSDGQGLGQPVVVDVGQLANILMQA